MDQMPTNIGKASRYGEDTKSAVTAQDAAVQRSVDDHVKRMLDESNELAIKIGNLTIFTSTAKFDSLPQLDQYLLVAQLTAMQSYAAILAMRLKVSTDRGVFLAECE